ncbi:MAG: hypothetical protein ABI718_11495 [Acidobacteriota bacterium]
MLNYGPFMHIYFSGSISGGRDDVDLYRAIVENLRTGGHHVIAGEVTNPELHGGGEPLGDQEIFERDLAWIEEISRLGGVLVAEVSTPSTGVGYEVAAARYRFRIPVICLYRAGRTQRCSAMVAGDPEITLIRYDKTDMAELFARLGEVLRTMDQPANDAGIPASRDL